MWTVEAMQTATQNTAFTFNQTTQEGFEDRDPIAEAYVHQQQG
jgi:hypothetical protein